MQTTPLPGLFSNLPPEQVKYLFSFSPTDGKGKLRKVSKEFWPFLYHQHGLYPVQKSHYRDHIEMDKSYWKCRIVQNVATPIFQILTLGIGQGCLFFTGQALLLFPGGWCFVSALSIYYVPTMVAMKIFGRQIASWVAPIGGIIATTAAAYVYYTLAPYALLKGIIYLIHSMGMICLVELNPRAGINNLLPLRAAVERQFIEESEVKLAKWDIAALESIKDKTSVLSGIALIVSYCAILAFSSPIIALSASVTIALLVRVVYMRLQIDSANAKYAAIYNK